MDGDVSRLLRRADQAMTLTLQDRDGAEKLALDVLEANKSVGSAEVEARAARTLALVQLHRGRPDLAAAPIDRAVAAADDVEDPHVLGHALLTRMGVRVMRGDASGALDDADRAEVLLDGHLRSQLRVQRATVLATGLGRVEEAIAEYDLVLGDDNLALEVEVIARTNRGLQLMRRGDLDGCAVDLTRARVLYEQLGNVEAAGEMTLHLAQVAARRGDYPAVFELHESALAAGLSQARDPRTAIDLCDAVLTAGLSSEAAGLAGEAAALALATDNMPAALEAWVRLGEIHVWNRDWPAARRALSTAAELSVESGNDGWRARADLAASRIPLALGESAAGPSGEIASSGRIRALEDAVQTLDQAGWIDDATEARILLAQLALDRGDRWSARTALPVLGRVDSSATARDRARTAHIRALRFLTDGRTADARRELARALRATDAARGQVAAEDLRSAASDRAVEVTRLGLELAVASGRARSILEWSERQRATALRLSYPRVGNDVQQEQRLGEIRSVDGADQNDAVEIRRKHLERQISRRSRSRRATLNATEKPASATEIALAVGDRMLVEYASVADRVHATVVHSGRVRHVRLDASMAELKDLVVRLNFGLRRLAIREGPSAMSAEAVVDAAVASLDAILLTPILGDGRRARRPHPDLVIVPTSTLYGLPWASLPGLADRNVTVAPSAHLWCAAAKDRDSRAGSKRVAVIAGPELDHAVAECEAVARFWPGCRFGTEHTVLETLDQLAAADLAHIAAHGRFRSDSPLFSSLLLADGPLMVHDLDRVDRLPPTMVLSSCDLGSVAVGRSDDPLGFPAALFARGVRTLVASLLPVSDEAARVLMVELHRSLVSGDRPAAALRAAATAVRPLSSAHRAAADCFVVFGVG